MHAAGTQFLLLVSAGKSCLSAMCGRGCKEEAEEALHQLVILFKIINYPSIIFVFSSVKFRGRSRREGWKVMEDSSAVFENKKIFCSCSTANLVVVLFVFFGGAPCSVHLINFCMEGRGEFWLTFINDIVLKDFLHSSSFLSFCMCLFPGKLENWILALQFLNEGFLSNKTSNTSKDA